MPKSKHRRKNKNRPRVNNRQHAPVRTPDPSPPWVPKVGGGLLLGAVVVILLGYLPAVESVTRDLPWIGANWSLLAGFGLMVSGFLVLVRWR